MKTVHDILNVQVGNMLEPKATQLAFFPVAFIQHGNREEGFHYEIVCPYCSLSIGMIDPQGDMLERNKGMAIAMAVHYKKGCSRFGAHHFLVKKADKPLGTDRLPTIQ